jgi:hypothetical protein
MDFRDGVMKLGTFVATLLLAVLPVTAGTLFTGNIDSASAAAISAGTYAAGVTLNISVTGTANLNSPSTLIITNPDGSMVTPVAPASCVSCWAPGYQFFIEGSTTYPTVAGGDGTNHFVGGGGNYDLFPGSHSPWATEGKQTTDTTDPGAIRFGALAYTFVANTNTVAALNPTDWHQLAHPLGGGLFGSTISSGSGGTLMVVVVDTFYSNNSGSFNLTITDAPEPSVAWLIFSGLGLFGLARVASRRRVH